MYKDYGRVKSPISTPCFLKGTAMSNRGTALIDGRYAEFQAAVLQQLPREIHPDILKHWIEDRESLKRVLESALVPVQMREGTLPTFNHPFLYQTLGMEFHPGELEVPEDPNHWDIYVMKGVTPNMVVAALRKQGVIVDTYVDDLDKGVSINDRDPKNGSYRVRFKANIEADPEYVNKSANDLKEEKIQGITLLERLLLELAYFLATKKHLDIENITLCSGSRYSGGCVPGVDWSADDRKLFVDWYGPQHRHSDLRARAVVS